jgi:PIN domain nuclease of toxin-antitoxin system
VNLLLDTHALLWWLDDAGKLDPSARDAIGDPANRIFISAIVIWEIVVKRGLGKLQVNGDFDAALAANPFHDLPITIAHARAIAQLPPIHRDPFDRMLVAQAIVEGFHLVTRDPLVAQYPVAILRA